MAHYKHINTSPRFLAVDLQLQLLPGTYEHVEADKTEAKNGVGKSMPFFGSIIGAKKGGYSVNV